MLRYLHGLAERLSMTIGDLTERMTETELMSWMAYDAERNSETSSTDPALQQMEREARRRKRLMEDEG